MLGCCYRGRVKLTTWITWVEGERDAELLVEALFAETAAERCAARFMPPDVPTVRVCVQLGDNPPLTFEVARASVYSTRQL